MSTWNFAAIAQGIYETSPDLPWLSVAENLDSPECRIPDADALKIVVDIFQRITKKPFPSEVFVRKWRNPDVQWSFVRAALSSPEQIVFWESSNEVLIIAEGLVPPVPPALMNFVQPYTSIPLGMTLFSITWVAVSSF